MVSSVNRNAQTLRMFNNYLAKKANVKYISLARVAVSLLFLFTFQYAGFAMDGVLYRFWRRGFLSATWLIVAAQTLGSLAAFFAVLTALRLPEQKPLKETLSSLGFADKRYLLNFAFGAGIGLILLAASLGLLLLRGEWYILGLYNHVNLHILVPELIELLALVSLGVLCEELLFRGYILQTLEPAWGTGFALTFSAVAFGSYHGYYLSKDVMGGILAPVISALVGGFLMGGAYVAARTLWLPLGIHFAWNCTNALVFGASGYGTYSVFRHTSHFTLAGYYVCLIPNALAAIGLIYFSVRLRRWNNPG